MDDVLEARKFSLSRFRGSEQLYCVCVLAAALLGFTSRGDAQSPYRLVGVYDLETGAPIPDVQIVLLGSALEWRTSASGLAVLRNLPTGDQILRVRRIGYEPHSEYVAVSPSDTVPLTLVLKPLAMVLPEVVVNARESLYERKLSGFLNRRRSSAAPASSFITEESLRRWGAVRWSDALSRSPGVQTGVRSGISLRGCSNFALFLDGILLSDNNLEWIPLETVAAIEVYRGAAQLPAEFNTTKSACGAIVVWTK